jgi:hypothetical protein
MIERTRTMQSCNTIHHFAQRAYFLVTYSLNNKHLPYRWAVIRDFFLYNGDVLHYLCGTNNASICALLEYYARHIGNSLPTFRDNLLVPSSRVKESKKKPSHRRVLSVISDFRREVDEMCSLLGYCGTYIGNLVPTFRDNLSAPIFKGQEFLGFLTLEGGTERMSRIFGTELPLLTA